MASYSVNKVILIGNLTRDPELRYTPQGTAVCSFGVATNRTWTTPDGEVRDEADFHNIVAWRKLAEICDQILSKGRKVYVSGRLQTRDWTGDDGVKRYRTEIVINEMLALDTPPDSVRKKLDTQSGDRGKTVGVTTSSPKKTTADDDNGQDNKGEKSGVSAKSDSASDKPVTDKSEDKEEINPEDIPF